MLESNGDGTWEALARPSRRLRPGVELEFDRLLATVVSKPEGGRVRVRFDTDDVEHAIEMAGSMPLPPYFRGTLDDDDRYQTLFAARPGSAAAPTAGLHFTRDVLDRLEGKGVGLARVDLHVSLDTFRPMSGKEVEDHEMHSEWCSVPSKTAHLVANAREQGGRVIAVGTTVVRTLETLADGNGGVEAGETRTDMFLKPGSEFGVVDALITNFHLPGSTLLVMLAAFMGPGWRQAYATALDRGYRFLSFGDAMFCVRSDT